MAFFFRENDNKPLDSGVPEFQTNRAERWSPCDHVSQLKMRIIAVPDTLTYVHYSLKFVILSDNKPNMGIWDTLNMLFHLILHIYGLLKVTWPPATQVCAKGQLQGLAVIWSPEFDGSLKGSQWFDGETGRICLKATVWSSRWCARKWQVNKLWWLLAINKPPINPYWGGQLWCWSNSNYRIKQ